MKNTKMIKGYCRKSNQHFGIEVKKFGMTWRVVDFIHITEAEAAVMTSEVTQRNLESNDNLLPCAKCGTRRVGSCSCVQNSMRCTPGVSYNLQCLYCRNMELDYTEARAVDGLKDGDVIHLAQGQVVKIRVKDGKPVERIRVGLGWDPVSNSAYNMDIDSSVFVTDNSGNGETVYFGELEHPSGCVKHHGDNVTGIDAGNGDDENIDVYLNKVPRNRNRIVFVINIYGCEGRGQTLGDVKNMYIRLYDARSGSLLIEYRVDQNLYDKTALVIGMAFRDAQGWQFKAIGKGSTATDVTDLFDECRTLR